MNEAVDTASSIISGKIPLLQIPEKEQKEPIPAEVIDCNILANYYAALTNLFCQAYLPPREIGKSSDVLQPIIEASYADFQMLDGWLQACDPNAIWASLHSNLYQQVRQTWVNQVKDWGALSKGSSITDQETQPVGKFHSFDGMGL